MVSRGASQAVAEEVVNYYYDRVCSAADTLYRFAYAVSLDLTEASRCVQEAYKEVSSDLEKLYKDDVNVLPLLMRECFKHYQKGGHKGIRSQSSVSKLFADLDVSERATIAAIDIVGLSAEEAVNILGINEADIRRHLAKGRAHLFRQQG